MVDAMGDKRAIVVLLCAVALATLVVAQAVVSSKPAQAATYRLPDLAMAKLTNIRIQNASGRHLLRFDTKVVNTGVGRFEVHGSRTSTATPTMGVTQRIFDGAGEHRDLATPAKMYYAGDGHNHWHVRDLQRFTLTRLDNGAKVGTGAKHGFCFFDNYRFGSTREPYYTAIGGSCAPGEPRALRVKMGLSVGWGDTYGWKLPGQYVDVTGLSPGRYRLRCVADPRGWFREKDDTNNFTWVDLQLTRDGVTELNYGPSAQPISG